MVFKIHLLTCAMLLLSIQPFAQNEKRQSKKEPIEWSHSWIIAKPDSGALPGLLIIGDSHVERYQPVVANKLKGFYAVSKITTSGSMGDPEYINQIKALLGNVQFDVICFNNGLHGTTYPPEEYAKYIAVVYKLLRKNNSKVKIIWATTTARRMSNNLESFDSYNEDVKKRNRSVTEFCTRKNIPMVDFYEMSMNHIDYYTKDGIHFNDIGVNAQAQMIVDSVYKMYK
ncbi:MAG: SGNH/GDSL hydrolase family protein [Sediminibacterium sp.]